MSIAWIEITMALVASEAPSKLPDSCSKSEAEPFLGKMGGKRTFAAIPLSQVIKKQADFGGCYTKVGWALIREISGLLNGYCTPHIMCPVQSSQSFENRRPSQE